MRNSCLLLSIATLVLFLVAGTAIVLWLGPFSKSPLSQAAPAAAPTLITEPASGGPDTLVTLLGSGFPANTQVTIHLGPPNVGATPNSYAEATTDGSGNLKLVFRMPATWPDGMPITEPKLIIGALAGQGETKALAEFTYSR